MTIRKTCRAASLAIAGLVALAAPAWAACDAALPSQTPTSRYVINHAEVYDTKTDLTWARCSVGQTWQDGAGCTGEVKLMNHDQAMKQQNGAWRVPTKDELASIVAPECRSPALNEEAFPNMDLEKLWYWAGTPYSATASWGIYFTDGGISYSANTYLDPVRLVRSGK